MNKKLRNTLIALAVIIFVGLVVWKVIEYFNWWNLWTEPLIKLF